MECRSGCGACCIAASIAAYIPGMPEGKPAGVACVQLDQQFRCRVFDSPERPEACRQFKAEPEVCGNNRDEALEFIHIMELKTLP